MTNSESIVHIANLLIEAVEKLSELIEQPDPDCLEREAQRVDKPLEERSVPGVIINPYER